MKIKLILLGKTEEKWLNAGIDEYTKRIKRYIKADFIVIPELKNTKSLSTAQQKQKEAELLQKHIDSSDHVVLLDEFGKEYRSVDFAKYMQKKMNSGIKTLCFIIGGPYGFDENIHKMAREKISLSKMTFSHQMIRLLFVEQVYRAFSIIRNEPYHHE